jgi:uncharacterized protein YkwD
MKAVWLAVVLAITATLAHAENITAMVSQYRRAHGLSAVKTDPQLTAIAKRQAKAMAATGVMDHSVAGSFSSRIAGAHSGIAAENIAAGTRTWADTFRVWKHSSGHNANLLLARADSVGFAVARNKNTRYKTFWAMVIADKSPRKKSRGRVAAKREMRRSYASAEPTENPIDALKSFVCKYLC